MIRSLGSGRVKLIGAHVDALELSWAPTTRTRFGGEETDPLGRLLAEQQFAAHQSRRPVALEQWGWRDDYVRVLPRGVRSWTHAFECNDWLGMIGRDGAQGSRGLFQIRSDYLAEVGAVEAVRQVQIWTARHLLPRTRRDTEWPVAWRVARIDLAADLAGVRLKASDLSRFTSRASKRTARWESVAAHERGRTFTGFQFGRRGGPLHARIYLKSAEIKDRAAVVDRWRAAGYDSAQHGRDVWRVELEARGELLRTLRVEGEPLSRDPVELVELHLPSIWRYGIADWLVLRRGGTTRIERAEPVAWWARLADSASAFGENESFSLERRAGLVEDPDRLLKLVLGSLSSYAAQAGLTTWSDTHSALDSYLHAQQGVEAWERSMELKRLAALPLRAPEDERLARWPAVQPFSASL